MKPILRLGFFILSSLWIFAQEPAKESADSVAIEAVEIGDNRLEQDSLRKPRKALFVGVDLLHPALAALTEKQGAQGFVQLRWNKKWEFVAEVGFESNVYTRNQFDVEASGAFGRAGFNYFITKNPPTRLEGFYLGFRLGYSAYNQEIKQFPIRGFYDPFSESGIPAPEVEYGSLEKGNVSALWAEPVAGARVRLFNTNFYADVSGRPQVYLGGKTQEGFDNLVVPGYGKDIGTFNFNLLWGISYQF